MSKRTIIPLFVALFITAAGCIMMAARAHTAIKAKEAPKNECSFDKSQGDMMIWESLGRTIATISCY